jgi:hypothetical protein
MLYQVCSTRTKDAGSKGKPHIAEATNKNKYSSIILLASKILASSMFGLKKISRTIVKFWTDCKEKQKQL